MVADFLMTRHSTNEINGTFVVRSEVIAVVGGRLSWIIDGEQFIESDDSAFVGRMLAYATALRDLPISAKDLIQHRFEDLLLAAR